MKRERVTTALDRLQWGTWRLLLRVPEKFAPQRLRKRREIWRFWVNDLSDSHWGMYRRDETLLPEGESLSVPVVLAVEFYTPTHARSLAAGLRALGIKRTVGLQGDAADVVRQHRGQIGRSGANLGTLVRKEKAWGDMAETNLPAGLDAIFLWSTQVTPSVTAIIASCTISDELAGSLNSVVQRTDFRASMKRAKRGWSFTLPSQVKQAAVRKQRSEIRAAATGWLSDALPGAFASGDGAEIPAVEAILLAKEIPFPDRDHDSKFLDFVDLGWSPSVLQSDSLPGWRLAFDHNSRSVATLAANRDEAMQAEKHGDGSDGWFLAHRFQITTLDDIVGWAASELLIDAQRRIAVIRDELPATRSGRRVLSRLKRIRGAFLQDTLDTRTLADELKAWAEQAEQRFWMSASWRSAEKEDSDWTLLDGVMSSVQARAPVLAASEQRLRDAISTETNVISAIANLRAQLYLGIVTVLVAVAIAWHPHLHHVLRRWL